MKIQDIAAIRTYDLSEPLDLYLQYALQLESTGKEFQISRAEFIRKQCSGKTGKQLFDKYRDAWGIPYFPEDLITVKDFKRGFLWKFRDHTTSWGYNQQAKKWFLTSPEGQFIKRYEFWTCDNGYDECVDVREGTYKEILVSLLKDQDYEAMISPAFSNEELHEIIDTYSPENWELGLEDLIEGYMKKNPNFTI